MEYKAIAKYVKISPRKVRLLARSLKGISPSVIVAKLRLMRERAARPMMAAIASALANAKARNVSEDALRVQSIDVMEGPAAKRWRAVSRGNAHQYKRRTTHIRVTLTDEKMEEEKIVKSS